MADEVAKRLGSVLRKIRTNRELSQKVFAKIIRVDEDTYPKYEQGLRKPGKLLKWIDDTIRLINQEALSMHYDTLSYSELAALRDVVHEGKRYKRLTEVNEELTESIPHDVISRIRYLLSLATEEDSEVFDTMIKAGGLNLIYKRLASLTDCPIETVKQFTEELLGRSKYDKNEEEEAWWFLFDLIWLAENCQHISLVFFIIPSTGYAVPLVEWISETSEADSRRDYPEEFPSIKFYVDTFKREAWMERAERFSSK
jgi:transcriptional regulator with XRE-family HTH domain